MTLVHWRTPRAEGPLSTSSPPAVTLWRAQGSLLGQSPRCAPRSGGHTWRPEVIALTPSLGLSLNPIRSGTSGTLHLVAGSCPLGLWFSQQPVNAGQRGPEKEVAGRGLL